MTLWHVDYATGSPANDGLSWGAPKSRTADLSTLTPGDEVRIAQTPDPILVGPAAWTRSQSTVVLAAPAVLQVDACDTAWTAATNVTATTINSSGRRVEGTNAASIAIAAAFTTGKVAHRALPATLDLSGYRRLSFMGSPSQNIGTPNTLALALCSDAAGNVPLATLPIPHTLLGQSTAYPVVLDAGGPLPAGVNSVALYALLDPGTVTVYLDNLLACNDLHHQSQVGKALVGDTWDAKWYPVRSIEADGRTINLGNGTNAYPYAGTDDAAAPLYARNPVYVDLGLGTVQIVNLTTNGTALNPITVSGGWDPSTGVQAGRTLLTNLNPGATSSQAALVGNRAYSKISRLDFTYVGSLMSQAATSPYQLEDLSIAAFNTTAVSFTLANNPPGYTFGNLTLIAPVAASADLITCVPTVFLPDAPVCTGHLWGLGGQSTLRLALATGAAQPNAPVATLDATFHSFSQTNAVRIVDVADVRIAAIVHEAGFDLSTGIAVYIEKSQNVHVGHLTTRDSVRYGVMLRDGASVHIDQFDAEDTSLSRAEVYYYDGDLWIGTLQSARPQSSRFNQLGGSGTDRMTGAVAVASNAGTGPYARVYHQGSYAEITPLVDEGFVFAVTGQPTSRVRLGTFRLSGALAGTLDLHDANPFAFNPVAALLLYRRAKLIGYLAFPSPSRADWQTHPWALSGPPLALDDYDLYFTTLSEVGVSTHTLRVRRLTLNGSDPMPLTPTPASYGLPVASLAGGGAPAALAAKARLLNTGGF